MIAPQNNRDLNQGVFHLWSKFGDPSLNRSWVIAWTGKWLTHKLTDTQTQATTIPEGQNWPRVKNNKANLRDLIAATGLVISNWIQIINFSARVTVNFDWWPCKKIGHLFYATSSFVHHFVAIGEFKLELQSGNAQFGSKSTIFLAVWPRNFTDDPQKKIGYLFYATSSFVHHFVAIGEFKLKLQSGNDQSGSNSRFLEPCDLEIWRMTLQNNRAPLLSYFKLCASFRSHWWIQTWVTVWKRPIWVKFDDF